LSYAVPEEVARLLKQAGQSAGSEEPVVPLEGRSLLVPVAQPFPLAERGTRPNSQVYLPTAPGREPPGRQPANSGAPTEFQFDYKFDPSPGVNTWSATEDGNWQQVWPGGTRQTFRVLGRLKVEGDKGTLLERQPDKGLYVFLPDKNSARMWLRFRLHPQDAWNDLGEMQNVK
jgi:hypothetical protein